MNALDDAPVDVAAVQDDEALLSVLPFAVRGGDGLVRRLLAARWAVHSEPFPPLVDVDTAQSVIEAGRRSLQHWHPVWGPVACALAVLLLVFSVLGLVSLGAEPGEWLWPLHELLFGGAR